MLNRLKYSVTFPSTGRTLSADLKFERGLTAITGPNESGKTMVLEVARWLLFGAAVLRGKAEDYKTLTATGEFVIKDNIVKIERTSRGATMWRNDKIVATGTKPVNAKVVEELGFGLNVFDVANSINQGEVEKLGSMTPAARKTMVDSVLGLAALDVIARWAADEAKALEKQAEGLQEQLVHPGIEPAKPVDYVPSSKFNLAQLNADADELAQIEGWLSHPRARPDKPTTKIELPSENLVSLADKRRAARETVEGLKARISALPTQATFTAELLDQIDEAWSAFHDYDREARWAKMNPLPQFTEGDLLLAEDTYRLIAHWMQYGSLESNLEQTRAALAKLDKVDCPSCGHNFALHADHAARLQEQVELLEKEEALIKPSRPMPERPAIREDQIGPMRQTIQDYDFARMEAFEKLTPVAKPQLEEGETGQYRRQIDQVAERTGLMADLSVAEQSFASMADYESMLAERRAYEAALTVWQKAELDYQAWLAERDKKTIRKAQLAGAVERRDAASAAYQVAVSWEAMIDRFETTKEVWDRQQERIQSIKADAEEHRKVREVMAVLRGLIKQHVLPSLNAVASQLLRQMTGGERNIVAVDDDFNVMIDGQDLDTLSGSGKAVANLSLRIALGQVLTNRVMSIMLADEIDASMDDFRAEKTSDVLRMLEERVSQVLLVSHKQVDAPHHVRLGGFSADDDQPNIGGAD